MIFREISDENEEYTDKVAGDQGTGSLSSTPIKKIISINFERYEIKVELSEDDKFLGIYEIRIDQDFLEHEQKIIPKGYHDVDKYYED